MRLFSEQSHDLRVIRERRDRNLGTYVDIPRIARAQARLYDEVIATDQVVWCRLDAPPRNEANPLLLHVIEDDRADRVAVLDGMLWEWIIGQNCIPDDAWEDIRLATSHLEAAERDRRREEMKMEYARSRLPDDLWAHLRTDDITCRMPQVLLRWPFKKSSILDVKRW